MAEPTLETTRGVPLQGRRRPRQRAKWRIYDKACDVEALRTHLAKRGIDLICLHRKNRQKLLRQEGRKLRRYKRREKVERTVA